MAKDTAKKNMKANAQRMQWFRLITIAINAVYLLSIVIGGGDDSQLFSVWSIVGILFWSTQEYATLSLLASRGAPDVADDGSIIDCIDLADPNQLGIYSYAQDLLWVCWAVQLLSVFSSWLLVLYIPVPVMAVVKVWPYTFGPLLSRLKGGGNAQHAEPTAEDDPRSRLQRRREQLRARKGKAAKE